MSKKIPFISATIAVIILGLGYYNHAKANPSYYLYCLSASATTTQSFMTAGTGTTTNTCDVTTNDTGYSADRATLLVNYVASTSATVPAKININIEYSLDGIDWYEDGGNFTNGFSTTTKPYDLTVNQFVLSNASSTAGLGASPTRQSTTTRAITINTPTRYVRAIFTVPVSGVNASVWSEFVAKKEQR